VRSRLTLSRIGSSRNRWLALSGRPSSRSLPAARFRAVAIAALGVGRHRQHNFRRGAAEAARVQRSVLWNAARLLLLGLAIGLATAVALARLLEGLLFQVQPHDLTVYAAVSGVLLAVGLAAAYLPARRASRVDPLIALRAE
jgi:hypothetical protein